MNSRTISEVNINFNISNLQDKNQNIDFNNQNQQEEFISFINESQNITIDITKNFASLTINYTQNVDFDIIAEIFNKIAEEIKSAREDIRLNRIGIRKVNLYIFKTLENINEYFEETLFNFNELIEKNKISIKQQLESYIYDNYKVNQNSEIQKGILVDNLTMQEEERYRIILDLDIYDDQIQENEIDIEKMNANLFELYKANLKEEFLNNLKSENYENEEILKV